jgi:hypothetical protein
VTDVRGYTLTDPTTGRPMSRPMSKQADELSPLTRSGGDLALPLGGPAALEDRLEDLLGG